LYLPEYHQPFIRPAVQFSLHVKIIPSYPLMRCGGDNHVGGSGYAAVPCMFEPCEIQRITLDFESLTLVFSGRDLRFYVFAKHKGRARFSTLVFSYF